MAVRTVVRRFLEQRCREMAGDQGASAIELALLAPALILVTMLVIQWALWFQARQVALDAAQQGARYAREQLNDWPAQSVVQAQDFYNRVGTKVLTGLSVRVNPDGGKPNQVYVTVTGDVPTLIPGLPKLTVHETAGGDVECFRSTVTEGQQCG